MEFYSKMAYLFRNFVERCRNALWRLNVPFRARRGDPATSMSISAPIASPNTELFSTTPGPSILAQSTMWWLLGDWDALLAIGSEELESHPGRAELALYIAAAELQKNGNTTVAKHLIQRSAEWGCAKEKIKRILLSGVYNSLGRVNKIAGSEARSSQHFERAFSTISPIKDMILLSEVRRKYQLLQIETGRSTGEKNDILPASQLSHVSDGPIGFSSAAYWDDRYRNGRNSGNGSYGKLAEFKANTVNAFIAERKIEKVIEFGCGDGNQLAMFNVPHYIGVDVSPIVVAKCRQRFEVDLGKNFLTTDEFSKCPCSAELVLSLDVIFHLVEDDVYHDYMERLFSAAEKFCIIYSCNDDAHLSDAVHVKRRAFVYWVKANHPEWRLAQVVYNPYPHDGTPNPQESSFSDFFFYEKIITN